MKNPAINILYPFLETEFPILQGFGDTQLDYSKFGLKGHNGIDYDCPVGTPIYASISGTIGKVGYEENGYGNFIRINTEWPGKIIYGHLSSCTVNLNSKVTLGQFIGRTGNTGFSTTPHLHFEARLDSLAGNGYNGAFDPSPYISKEINIIKPIADIPKTLFPKSGKIQILVNNINLRYGPDISTSIVGIVYKGCVINYINVKTTTSGVWVQIFDNVWCAFSFGNTVHCKLV